jgi:hypothetical protein
VATDAGVGLTVGKPRCVGSIDGPVGDCSIPPVVVLLTMGIIDEDGQALAAEAAAGLVPVPLAFCTCAMHKRSLVKWARTMWGAYFDGDLYPIDALPALRRELEMDDLPVAINPDPAWAVQITHDFAETAG